MDLGPRQRENLAKALFDVGKLVLAFDVLGPLSTSGGVRIGFVIGGLLVFLALFAIATSLDKGR